MRCFKFQIVLVVSLHFNIQFSILRKKEKKPKVKIKLHRRNAHRNRYDLTALAESNPTLAPFVGPNKFGDQSIDFANPAAVKALNQALLIHHYGLAFWDLPERYLTPAVPGRADYVHYIADLMATKNNGSIPTGQTIRCLDIGVGANCVYPIIGNYEYGWSFVGADIDKEAIASAQNIIDKNKHLEGVVELRIQNDSKKMFSDIIKEDELYDMVICNPPFHANLGEARYGSLRKLKNINKEETYGPPKLNFAGRSNELWTKGGEKRFIRTMITESEAFAKRCFWFSSLVSKHEHLDYFYNLIEDIGAYELNTLQMGQGNKRSRVITWTFLSPEEQEKWAVDRWKNSAEEE